MENGQKTRLVTVCQINLISDKLNKSSSECVRGHEIFRFILRLPWVSKKKHNRHSDSYYIHTSFINNIREQSNYRFLFLEKLREITFHGRGLAYYIYIY